MSHNHSPWLYQLNRTRPVIKLDGQRATDVVIIGGGIAGIATAFFILQRTKRSVILVEGDKIAHGATGHNGGFLASYFERTFSSIVQEFGLDLATEAQKEIETAWDLLDAIRRDAKMITPMWQFPGYAACATYEEVLLHLRNNALRRKAGLHTELVMVSDQAPFLQDLPKMYRKLYTVIGKRKLLNLLETRDESYVAILPARKGVMNSAAFSEELAGYLLNTYTDRFSILEHTPVKKLVLKKDRAVAHIGFRRKIKARQAVLCTNGFEYIKLVNKAGISINKKFHATVRGIVGYMAGYLEKKGKKPAEISYLPKKGMHGRDVYEEEPYFYMTRRPYGPEKHPKQNLICIGGPEALMDDTNNYRHEHPYPSEARRQINDFLKFTYKHQPKKIRYQFLWHGLMGFTPKGVRLIGPEPANPRLYYNLGCNGVGLLPSIYGGKKISRYIAGEKMKPSIFDPRFSEKVD